MNTPDRGEPTSPPAAENKPSPRHRPGESDGELASATSSIDAPLEVEAVRALADAMPVLVWVTRADGNSEYYNRRWLEYTGLAVHQATPDDWHAFLHEDDRDRCIACWTRSVASGEPYEAEYRFRRAADGQYRWHLARALPTRDAAGRVVRWFGTCTDIHDQKVAEQLLEQAGRTKDEFLSIVSHELRTPLSAILGWTQLLEMDVLDDTERREAIETIKQQAKAQSQLIEDLLDVSRILNGKFHLRQQSVSLGPIILAAINTARPIAAQAGVTLTQGAWDGALVVQADPQRIQQVVTNLLTNAIKFTPKDGRVEVSLTTGDGSARVAVRDSGMGVPVAEVEAIFERFKQVGSEAIRDKGGLGLGLSIVKHVVDAHGGTVCAKSEGPGRGSMFEMTLPVAAVPGEASTPSTPSIEMIPDAVALSGVRLLVVDDEESARTVIAAALKKAGAEVTTARGAADAWSLLGQQPFDVLVSDLGMPGETGLGLIARIRQSQVPFRGIPALALTGFASVDDQTHALAAGFQMHAAKPVEPLDLVRRVLAVGRHARGG